MFSILSLGNADARLLTTGNDVLSPGSQTWFVTKATVNNQDSVAHKYTAWRVAAGATAGTSVPIVYALSVPAGETLAVPVSGQEFQANQVFHVVATATGVLNINVSYAVMG